MTSTTDWLVALNVFRANCVSSSMNRLHPLFRDSSGQPADDEGAYLLFQSEGLARSPIANAVSRVVETEPLVALARRDKSFAGPKQSRDYWQQVLEAWL